MTRHYGAGARVTGPFLKAPTAEASNILDQTLGPAAAQLTAGPRGCLAGPGRWRGSAGRRPFAAPPASPPPAPRSTASSGARPAPCSHWSAAAAEPPPGAAGDHR